MLSSEQRARFLREMGYQPLRLRGVGGALPASANPAPSRSPASSTAATAPQVASSAVTAGPRDPLLRALLAAAGAATAQPVELGWEERLTGPAFDFDGPTLRINPIALRQQPAAKRALWKTLRSLRARRLHGP